MVVAGVARDMQAPTLRNGVPPMLYMAVTQGAGPGGPPEGDYLVRGSFTGAMLDTLLKRIDPKLHAEQVRTLEEDLSRSILPERIMGTLSAFFGVLSLLLVSDGIYGVMAFPGGAAAKGNRHPVGIGSPAGRDHANGSCGDGRTGWHRCRRRNRRGDRGDALVGKDTVRSETHRPAGVRGGVWVTGRAGARGWISTRPGGSAAQSGGDTPLRMMCRRRRHPAATSS